MSDYTNGNLQEFFSSNSKIPAEEVIRALREKSMAMFSSSREQAKAGLAKVLDSWYTVVEFNSKELELLKILETYIRRGTLEPQQLARILGELDEYRSKVLSDAMASSQKGR